MKSNNKIHNKFVRVTSSKYTNQNNQIFTLEDSIETNGIDEIFKFHRKNMISSTNKKQELDYIKVICKKKHSNSENRCYYNDYNDAPGKKRNSI